MTYIDNTNLNEYINESEVEELAIRLFEIKDDEQLAINDAKMVLAIYGKRKELNEHSSFSRHGFRTWWLTGETRIFRYTKDFVAKYNGYYTIRPEFLLKFITLSPKTAEVYRTYKNVFPTKLSISM